MIDRMGRDAMRCAFDDRGPLRAATVSGELLQMPAIGGLLRRLECNGKERCFAQKQPNCQVRFVRSAGQMIRGSKGEMDGGSLGRPVFKYLPVGEERRAFALTEVNKVGFPEWCVTVRMTSDGSQKDKNCWDEASLASLSPRAHCAVYLPSTHHAANTAELRDGETLLGRPPTSPVV